MDWEPTTLPWSRALQPGESSEAGRFTPRPQPLLSLAPRRELAQHLSVTSRKDQPPNRTTTGTGRDGSAQTCTLTQGHTHAYRGQESRWTHTYWNCSRCHWCLMSRPLQSNQRDPLQKEHGQEARGHLSCHPALLTKGGTALASRKTCSPAPRGTSLCHMGKGGTFHPWLGARGHAEGCFQERTGRQEGLPGRGEGTGLPRLREGGVHREDAVRGTGAACTQWAGEGTAVLAQGWGADLWG